MMICFFMVRFPGVAKRMGHISSHHIQAPAGWYRGRTHRSCREHARRCETAEFTENVEGFLCVLRVLRGETIGQAHTIIHSSFSPAPLERTDYSISFDNQYACTDIHVQRSYFPFMKICLDGFAIGLPKLPLEIYLKSAMIVYERL